MANQITTIADMQIVPEKFAAYVIDRSTKLNKFIDSGIATPDATVAQIINGTPRGGRFIQLPMWNALEGEDEVFGEYDVTSSKITTKVARATLLMRQHMWSDTDLSVIQGGADPLAAVGQLIADWRKEREQLIYLSIMKGLFATDGALKVHVNDISAGSGTAAYISDGATLDTKQLLGDHYASLGMVFMHSAVYTYLQKNGMITRNPIFDPSQSSVEMERYLGYKIHTDDSMPYISYEACASSESDKIEVTKENIKKIQPHCATVLTVSTESDKVYVKEVAPVFDTYFVGSGAFIRQEGNPQGYINVETDRDKIGAENFLINRWCQVIHPRGLSWISDGEYKNPKHPTPDNVDLANPANWSLVVDHKKVSMACLRHRISG